MVREVGSGEDERLREGYVEHVAAVDLEAEAVPTLMGSTKIRGVKIADIDG